MNQKRYYRPVIHSHERIVFETNISCNPPNIPATTNGGDNVCLVPDGSGWFPTNPNP
jgi:hypothetical protein